jgi:hypothetical protein
MAKFSPTTLPGAGTATYELEALYRDPADNVG